jgi:RNAse (barnase) inhibitor barstar
MELLKSLPNLPAHAHVVEIDGAKALTLRSFYPRIAKALFFPDYFGKNLDALFDCLCSLETLGQERVVLVVRNAKLFLSKEKNEKKQAVLEVLQDAEKAENRSDGVVFKVIGIV